MIASRALIWIVAALTLSQGCQSPADQARQLVERSVEVHGGLEAYQNLDLINWDKTTWLYDEDGVLESENIQQQSYQGGDEPAVILRWRKDSTFYEIESNQGITRYRLGDIILSEGEEVEQAEKQARSAAYVFFQPFKLLDQGANLSYEGTRTLGDSLDVEVVRVSYEGDDKDADVWRYYFDQDSKLVANSVEHLGRISLIINLEYQQDPVSGLLLNKRRKSYFVDSTLQIKYLRAEYLYEIQ